MRVALIQQKSYPTKQQTIDKTLYMITKAKEQDANLVILQELHQDRYFCINESIKNFDLANDFENDLKFWSKVAKDNKIVLVTSLFEKRVAGVYHNSAFVFDSDGSLAGKYRKMHIPHDQGFYEKFYFTPGDLGFCPIDTSVGRLGVLICWDQWFGEAARIMALKGAEILIYPTAIGWFDSDSEDEKKRQLDAWITIQRSHAISNSLPLVSVNRVGFEKDDKNLIDGIRFWGNSFIVGNQGEFLKQASNDKEEIILHDIDLKRCEKIRQVWPFFRDRRVDFYDELNKKFLS